MSETRDWDQENADSGDADQQGSSTEPEGRERPGRDGETSAARPSERREEGPSGRSTGGYGGRPGGRSGGGRGRYGRDRDGGGRRGGGGRFRRQRRKVCAFCVDKVKHIDYKDHQRLRDFVSDRGKILKSRMTGTCVKHQRKLSAAVKRARQVALLPFVAD